MDTILAEPAFAVYFSQMSQTLFLARWPMPITHKAPHWPELDITIPTMTGPQPLGSGPDTCPYSWSAARLFAITQSKPPNNSFYFFSCKGPVINNRGEGGGAKKRENIKAYNLYNLYEVLTPQLPVKYTQLPVFLIGLFGTTILNIYM